MTKTLLKSNQWLNANNIYIEMLKDTLAPHRASGLRNPVPFTDLGQLNALLVSLSLHIPDWTSDPMWAMYLMPYKSEGGLDDTYIAGIDPIQFKCFPYAHLLGKEFALHRSQETHSVVLKKIAKKSPWKKSPLLRMWRIWEQAGPSSLSPHPFQLHTPDSNQPGRYVLRSCYTKIMVARFYDDETFQVTGCSLCSQLHDKENDLQERPIFSKGIRICTHESETGNRCGCPREIRNNGSFYQMVCRGHGQSWNTCHCENRRQTSSPGKEHQEHS